MTLFDPDEVEVAQSAAPKVKAPPRQKARLKQDTIEGLELPRKPVVLRDSISGDEIERAAQAVHSIVGHSNSTGEFRCDAVTHTFVVMAAQQFEYAGGGDEGSVLHPDLDDDDLEGTFAYFHGWMTLRHPWCFPPQDLWPVSALRRWTQLLVGVDQIGRRGELMHDVPSLVFCHSANMTSKQKAWGAFYTPFPICKMMIAATYGDSHGDDAQARRVNERPWTARVLEPCVGSGSFLVALFDHVRRRLVDLQRSGAITAAESVQFMREWVGNVHAVDVDPEAVWCTSAQIAMRTGLSAGSPDAAHPYRQPKEQAA